MTVSVNLNTNKTNGHTVGEGEAVTLHPNLSIWEVLQSNTHTAFVPSPSDIFPKVLSMIDATKGS